MIAVLVGTAALIISTIHPPHRQGSHWCRVDVALKSAKFGLSVLGFVLDFWDLIWKRRWSDVKAKFSEALLSI